MGKLCLDLPLRVIPYSVGLHAPPLLGPAVMACPGACRGSGTLVSAMVAGLGPQHPSSPRASIATVTLTRARRGWPAEWPVGGQST